jgi:hypothetical protein
VVAAIAAQRGNALRDAMICPLSRPHVVDQGNLTSAFRAPQLFVHRLVAAFVESPPVRRTLAALSTSQNRH